MWISVDVEADGPVPGLYSMVSFGAVVVEPGLSRTFYGQTAPISKLWRPESLAISKISREEHEAYPCPEIALRSFGEWLGGLETKRLTLITDNPAFDFPFISYYCHRHLLRNPFGFSARRIGDLWAGFQKDTSKASEWKKFRKTPHTHNPVDDAKGNAEALLHMRTLGILMPEIPT